MCPLIPSPLICTGSEDKQRITTANKARVRMLQCVIMALDRNPVEFAAFLPPFLSLYSTNALTAPDAAGVYALPAKRRVLLTTFLARALVCPHYEPDMIKFLKMKGGLCLCCGQNLGVDLNASYIIYLAYQYPACYSLLQ